MRSCFQYDSTVPVPYGAVPYGTVPVLYGTVKAYFLAGYLGLLYTVRNSIIELSRN